MRLGAVYNLIGNKYIVDSCTQALRQRHIQAHINDYYADAGIYVYDGSEHIKLTIV